MSMLKITKYSKFLFKSISGPAKGFGSSSIKSVIELALILSVEDLKNMTDAKGKIENTYF